MGKVIVSRKRDFHPHHVLLRGARVMLKDAETVESGYFYYHLSAIMLTAFALEAMANSFGKHIYKRWEDFESSSPIAKVRLVAERLNADVDFTKEPYSTTLWLIKFRNKVAHAKPQNINTCEDMSSEEALKVIKELPMSRLENEISLANAQKSVQAVTDIFDQWRDLLPDHPKEKLYGDGWFAKISPLLDEND